MRLEMTDLTRRNALVSSLAVIGSLVSSEAWAETASIRIKIYSAGFIVGASGGSGSITFRGKRRALSIGGISVGATIGASGTELIGTASNLRRLSDIEGVYTAVGAGVAVAGGAGVVQLSNSKGAVLRLKGRKIGLELKVDLSGLQISLK